MVYVSDSSSDSEVETSHRRKTEIEESQRPNEPNAGSHRAGGDGLQHLKTVTSPTNELDRVQDSVGLWSKQDRQDAAKLFGTLRKMVRDRADRKRIVEKRISNLEKRLANIASKEEAGDEAKANPDGGDFAEPESKRPKRELSSIYKREQGRFRNMFGILRTHLAKGREEMKEESHSRTAEKRKAVEQKIEEQVSEESARTRELQKQDMTATLGKSKEELVSLSEEVAKLVRVLKTLSNRRQNIVRAFYLHTNAENAPLIFYRPKTWMDDEFQLGVIRSQVQKAIDEYVPCAKEAQECIDELSKTETVQKADTAEAEADDEHGDKDDEEEAEVCVTGENDDDHSDS